MGKDMSKPEGPVRTFLALELPTPVTTLLASLQGDLRSVQRSLKLVEPALMHITLRFLGNVPVHDLPRVFASARAAAQCTDRFTLHLGEVGAFPDARAPRVVVARLERGGGLRHLEALHRALERALVAAGFPSDTRAYTPHITLARVREGLSSDDRAALVAALKTLAHHMPPGPSVPVNDLLVIRSDLFPTGPRYTHMARFALGRTA